MEKTGAGFSNYPSFIKLSELAKKPFDLKTGLSAARIAEYKAEGPAFKLLYAAERVDSEVMKGLLDLSIESGCLEKMKHMQAGEIVNLIEGFPSEKRSALHTATRDVFGSPNSGKKAAESALLAKKELEKLSSFIEKIETENLFTDLVLIGIGGSELGPKANYLALKYLQKPDRRVHFIGNVDPDDMSLTMRSLDLKKTVVLVVSKSGTTLETTVNEEFARSYFTGAGLESKNHFVSVSMPGSPLDDKTKYLECFHVWDFVGGRFSTTSMCGGVLLAFAYGFGVFLELLKGAHAMDKAALDQSLAVNLPLLGALLAIWNRNFLKLPTLAVIPYSQALARFPSHIQQVEMESNGKSINKKGEFVSFETAPVIWGEPGTNAQHSFYQMIHQGTSIVPLEFIGFKESQTGEDFNFQGTTSQAKLLANLFAQSIALAIGQESGNPDKVFLGNRPSHILIGKQLTPFTLGALLSYYEHKAVFQGFIWNINSFDQEGVQLGKVLAGKIIECFAKQNKKTYPIGEAFLQEL